jgi:hypothetical protein
MWKKSSCNGDQSRKNTVIQWAAEAEFFPDRAADPKSALPRRFQIPLTCAAGACWHTGC